ncbi:tetratricopeptide repeat protein [Limobrevibacterium gyesilva]|uniref:Tetratricopeptide repeat protein n=1 Tax=Limobrevibacterium gyesilva TaxID=2991712 RepID=A0AA41YQ16_9PROT|nr:tetratricopeptide repeat protein [Limobrevibacterium gyesilva]MCW3476621.1 tetratricopeptide repeat protein [Limobrevibacterium gyesilva]
MQHVRSLRRTVLLTLSLLSACAAADPASVAGDARGPYGPATRLNVPGVAAAFLSGRFAASQNDVGYAADEFLRALQADPGNVELRQQAFLTSLLAGRPEAVRLAALQSDNQAAQLLLADSDAKAGRWEQAENRFAALPRQGLMQLLQPLLVAWAQAGQGRTDAALATLAPLVQGQHFRAMYALHAALIADLGKRTAEAARLYRVAQSEFGSTNLQLGRLLASWQARQGFPDDARETLKAVGDNSPEMIIALPALQMAVAARQVRNPVDGIAEAYLALAAALRSQDAAEFSVVLLQLALDLRPDLTAARLLSAEIQETRNNPEGALAVLSPVPASDPLYAMVRLRQAALTDRLGNTTEALHMLDQLAKEFPTRPDPLTLQGDLLRSKRRFAEAVVAYDHAVALVANPTRVNWPLFYNRGIALDRAHQWARAEADFLKALELFPDQPFVLNYLGYSWTEQGRNLTRARQMIERAAELRPNDGEIADSLGWVVLRQGDVRGAVKYLERAVELEPEDATINAHLGDAYWAAGRKLEAQYQWRRSLNLKPEPEEVSKLQAKLREGDQTQHSGSSAVGEKTVQ